MTLRNAGMARSGTCRLSQACGMAKGRLWLFTASTLRGMQVGLLLKASLNAAEGPVALD